MSTEYKNMKLIKRILNWVLLIFSRGGTKGGGVSCRRTILIFNASIFFLLALFTTSCNSDSVSDCFQSAGDISRVEVTVADFTKITVFENVNLILKQGPEIKVDVETGENLRNEVTATVEDGRLLLRDTNDCNYVRAYGLTKIYVTAPNVDEIRSSTGLKIESDGVLAYPVLNLISESFNNPESETKDGEFDLELDSDNVSILVNGIAYFKLHGKANIFKVTVAAGDSRIEAQNLTALRVEFDHRGSNDLLINPQESLKGEIRGTGNVLSYHSPDVVEVESLYKGELIFKD